MDEIRVQYKHEEFGSVDLAKEDGFPFSCEIRVIIFRAVSRRGARGSGAVGAPLGLCPRPRRGLPPPDPFLNGVCGGTPAGFGADPQLPAYMIQSIRQVWSVTNF